MPIPLTFAYRSATLAQDAPVVSPTWRSTVPTTGMPAMVPT
ncbi:hypothetical protein Q5530_36955 [Saccharothrix sp. BKS2]